MYNEHVHVHVCVHTAVCTPFTIFSVVHVLHVPLHTYMYILEYVKIEICLPMMYVKPSMKSLYLMHVHCNLTMYRKPTASHYCLCTVDWQVSHPHCHLCDLGRKKWNVNETRSGKRTAGPMSWVPLFINPRQTWKVTHPQKWFCTCTSTVHTGYTTKYIYMWQNCCLWSRILMFCALKSRWQMAWSVQNRGAPSQRATIVLFAPWSCMHNLF